MQRKYMQGVTDEMYYEYTKVKKEDILKEMRPEALKRLQFRYLLKTIIASEKIKVSDKETKARLKEMADMYQVEEEVILKEISMESINLDLVYAKALDIVTANEEKKATKKTTKKEEK